MGNILKINCSTLAKLFSVKCDVHASRVIMHTFGTRKLSSFVHDLKINHTKRVNYIKDENQIKLFPGTSDAK